ncbi:hypothetical protein Pan189_35930 [Stratiformator vulcanicus]|uniref:Uncharacterized protein n=1 Tax=Stratiformator vulcanicus TaxID=2527980 RepID=A0A517R5Q7_9PLAN|nr:hypothetical protein Pan189_35930 [Stratiformator vulcanicus]
MLLFESNPLRAIAFVATTCATAFVLFIGAVVVSVVMK